MNIIEKIKCKSSLDVKLFLGSIVTLFVAIYLLNNIFVLKHVLKCTKSNSLCTVETIYLLNKKQSTIYQKDLSNINIQVSYGNSKYLKVSYYLIFGNQGLRLFNMPYDLKFEANKAQENIKNYLTSNQQSLNLTKYNIMIITGGIFIISLALLFIVLFFI